MKPRTIILLFLAWLLIAYILWGMTKEQMTAPIPASAIISHEEDDR